MVRNMHQRKKAALCSVARLASIAWTADALAAARNIRIDNTVGSTSCPHPPDFSLVPVRQRSAVQRFYREVVSPFGERQRRNREEFDSEMVFLDKDLGRPASYAENQEFHRLRQQQREAARTRYRENGQALTAEFERLKKRLVASMSDAEKSAFEHFDIPQVCARLQGRSR